MRERQGVVPIIGSPLTGIAKPGRALTAARGSSGIDRLGHFRPPCPGAGAVRPSSARCTSGTPPPSPSPGARPLDAPPPSHHSAPGPCRSRRRRAGGDSGAGRAALPSARPHIRAATSTAGALRTSRVRRARRSSGSGARSRRPARRSASADPTDRAELHPRIVGRVAGAVYSLAVLGLGDQPSERTGRRGVVCLSPDDRPPPTASGWRRL